MAVLEQLPRAPLKAQAPVRVLHPRITPHAASRVLHVLGAAPHRAPSALTGRGHEPRHPLAVDYQSTRTAVVGRQVDWESTIRPVRRPSAVCCGRFVGAPATLRRLGPENVDWESTAAWGQSPRGQVSSASRPVQSSRSGSHGSQGSAAAWRPPPRRDVAQGAARKDEAGSVRASSTTTGAGAAPRSPVGQSPARPGNASGTSTSGCRSRSQSRMPQ